MIKRATRVPLDFPVYPRDGGIKVPNVYVADTKLQLTNLGELRDGDILFLDGRAFPDPNSLIEALGPGPDAQIIFIYPERGKSIADHVSVMTKEKFLELTA